MKIVRRSLTVLLGYATAAVSVVAIPFGVLAVLALALGRADRIPGGFLLYLFTLRHLIGGFSLLSVLPVIVILEVFGVRNKLAHAALGAVIVTGLSFYSGTLHVDGPAYAYLLYNIVMPASMMSAGVVTGLIYWRIAGRNAGAWRTSPS
jgi:hypothetical protein